MTLKLPRYNWLRIVDFKIKKFTYHANLYKLDLNLDNIIRDIRIKEII